MAVQYFGVRNPKLPPVTFNQSTLLQTEFRGKTVAHGRWTSAGFLLCSGSLIKKKNTLKSNFGLLEIRSELLASKLLIDNSGDYYLLTQDILLSSPSAAARIIHGNDRDGLKDWKTSSGQTLAELF